jgi:hypothetical protein
MYNRYCTAKEVGMIQESLWRGILIAVLILALATPARADGLQKLETEVVVGIVVAAVAIVVVVAVLVVHVGHHKSQDITGCIHSGANGMGVTDEKDQRDYALSGKTAGVKPGDRMTLQGKRKDTGNTLVFEAHKVTRDWGACQP